MFACLFYGFDDGGEYATGNCRVLKSFFADKYGSVRALGVIGKLCGFGLFGKVKKIGSFWGGWSGKVKNLEVLEWVREVTEVKNLGV